jgi:hypothetical protein
MIYMAGNYEDIEYSQYNHFSVYDKVPSSKAERDEMRSQSPKRERPHNVKATSDGGDKWKAKWSKDAMLENLVAIREKKLESYKKMKSKQIESYREIKFAQMEKNDPNNDP